jgi:hypothetical protein
MAVGLSICAQYESYNDTLQVHKNSWTTPPVTTAYAIQHYVRSAHNSCPGRLLLRASELNMFPMNTNRHLTSLHACQHM